MKGIGVVAGVGEVWERGTDPAGPDHQRAEHQGHRPPEVGQQHQVLAIVDLIRNAPALVEPGEHGHLQLQAGHVKGFDIRSFPKSKVRDVKMYEMLVSSSFIREKNWNDLNVY